MENYFEILKKCRMFTGLDIDDIKVPDRDFEL